ncbi:carboxypeptidase-like regulatory domain-containing protein [Photobacterium malacitanum]|nr:carboxypeptidase-like regulatory domain-containing protein [Photobacterium malacitanum]
MQSNSDDIFSYYRYFYENIFADSSLTIGDIVIPESMTNSIYHTKNGYSLTNYESDGEGRFYDERMTLADAYVDIYVNGIFIKTVQANNSGRYIVDGFSVMPGDMVNFKERIGIGKIVDTQIHIANTSESVLKQGHFAYSIQGEIDNMQRKRARFSYGLQNKLTLGVSAFHSNETTDFTVGFRAIPTSNIGISLAWITPRNDILAEIDFNLYANHYLKINYNRANLFAANNNQQVSQLEYRYYNSLASLTVNAIKSDEDFNTNVTIRSQFNSMLSGAFTINDTRANKASYTEYALAFNYIKSASEALELSVLRLPQDNQLAYNVNYRYQCDNCFFPSVITSNLSSYSFNASYGKDVTASAAFSVELTPALKLTTATTLNSISVSARYSYGVKLTKSNNWQLSSMNPDDYGYATINGQIIDHTGTPIPNVKVNVYRKQAMSDTNGLFKIEGVAIADNVALTLDPETIDINLQPQFNPLLINTQKGGVTNITVSLNRIFGVDGYVTNFDGHTNATITFLNNSTQHQLTYKIDTDGFFMIEGLTAADYTITYQAGERQASVAWSAINQQQWLSNLQLQINCIDQAQFCGLSINTHH